MKPIDIIGLKNFRIFDDQTGFLGELSSINVLTGANNSGKSSIIKALQLLKNSSKESQFPLYLDLNHQEHLLGDFDNVLFNKNNKRLAISLPFTFLGIKSLYVSLQFEVPTSKNMFKASLRAIEAIDRLDDCVVFSFAYRHASDEEKEAQAGEFEAELKAFHEKRERDLAEQEEGIFGTRFSSFPPFENPLEGFVEWSINLERLKKYLLDLKEFYLLYLQKRNEWVTLDKIDERITGLQFIPSILVSSFSKDTHVESWNEFIDDKIGDQKEISGREEISSHDFEAVEIFFPPNEIEDILYYEVLKIFRKNLIWTIEEEDGVKSSIMANSFESSWKALVQRISNIYYMSSIKEENSRIYNANSHTPFVNLLKEYVSLDNLNDDFINKYLKTFEIGKKIAIVYDPKYQLITVTLHTLDGDERELVDFGYGIKQLVQILIQISVLAETGRRTVEEYDDEGLTYTDYYDPKVLLVEEPESNLHPKWQSVLAEMFAEANSRFKIQLVIETHSEYLIRKFQTLMASGALKAESVKIFYLRNLHKVTQEKQQVESLFIEPDGSIDYTIFDGGFFDESTDLEFSLLNIQRHNFLKEFEKLKEDNDKNEDKIVGLEKKIDEYTKKIDLSGYNNLINLRFDSTKLSAVSVRYLVSGQFLLQNIATSDDFSPVILQYGRAVENELLQLFSGVKLGKRWSIGVMQAAMEEVITGAGTVCSAQALKGSKPTERKKLRTVLTSTFVDQSKLSVNLIDNLRQIRNEAGHPGHTKTRAQALAYITDANDFLDKWIGEKR